jgi:tetratricopeptide (TPR) repeat protein
LGLIAMPYDLFISYARRDNTEGRVSQLVDQIGADYLAFAGRPLNPFFDVQAIEGMQDWRHRILQGLRESRLLLLCLSPAYIASEYCVWEFTEYLKHEIAQFGAGEGIAPIYFVEVPGWGDKDFDARCAAWLTELRRRQAFDLRPWYETGQSALRDAAICARLKSLNEKLTERIRRVERAESSLGNTDAHNPHFIGRVDELRRLREKVALGTVGTLTVIHGLGGIGKTSLAMEYAQAFSHEYGGGRWQVRCEGKADLRVVLAELASPLGVEFTEDEKRDPQRQFERVLTQLRRYAQAETPPRCLLILDNVDRPELLATQQRQHLPSADWLHVIATTRLGPGVLVDQPAEAFLSVDQLPADDALSLIQTYLPAERFADEQEVSAAKEIVQQLDGFTLAIEATAVFLAEFPDVSCRAFLARLEAEGLSGVEQAVAQSTRTVRHGEKRLSTTLSATWERLSEAETLAVAAAALLPADHIALPWLRELLAARCPEFATDPGPGYPSAWHNLLRRLSGLRLLQPTGAKDSTAEVLVAKMHRLVQQTVQTQAEALCRDLEPALVTLALRRAKSYSSPIQWGFLNSVWELTSLTALAQHWLPRADGAGVEIAAEMARPLLGRNATSEADALLRPVLARSREVFGERHPVTATCLVQTAHLLRELKQVEAAIPLATQGLAIDLELFGSVHERVGRDYNELALEHHAADQLDLAEEHYRRALAAIPETPSVPSDPGLLRVIVQHNLADLHQAQGDFDRATAEFRDVLAALEMQLGVDHPYLATAWNNLAVNFHNSRQHDDEAEAAYRRAIALFQQCLGAQHVRVANTWHHLAILFLSADRAAAALEPLHQALAILDREPPARRALSAARRQQVRADLLAAMIGAGYSPQRILSEPGFSDADLPEIRRLRWRRVTKQWWWKPLRPFVWLAMGDRV